MCRLYGNLDADEKPPTAGFVEGIAGEQVWLGLKEIFDVQAVAVLTAFPTDRAGLKDCARRVRHALLDLLLQLRFQPYAAVDRFAHRHQIGKR